MMLPLNVIKDTFVSPLESIFRSRRLPTSVQTPNCILSGKVGAQYDDVVKLNSLDVFMDMAKLVNLLHFVIPQSVLYIQ